jgi:hypothetical protein
LIDSNHWKVTPVSLAGIATVRVVELPFAIAADVGDVVMNGTTPITAVVLLAIAPNVFVTCTQ